jgi:folate-binding protein YgfZ
VTAHPLRPKADSGLSAAEDPGFRGDYDALRRGVGAISVDRDVLRVQGPDAHEYLQGQCSQDLAALEVGGSADSLVLNPQGKLDALVRITRMAHDDFVVDVDGGYGGVLAARLARFKLRVKASIEPLAWRCVSLRGPHSAAAVGQSGVRPGTGHVALFSWNGVVGVDLLGEDPPVPEGVRECGTDAWDSVRVEAGIPRMGSELDDSTIAAEAGLLERCVSLTKGCYTGQELIARLDARGNRVARRLLGIVVGDPSRAGDSPMRPGQSVLVGDKTVGTVTSSAWSPALGGPIALAYVHRTVVVGSTVVVDRDGAPVPAEIRELPLVT